MKHEPDATLNRDRECAHEHLGTVIILQAEFCHFSPVGKAKVCKYVRHTKMLGVGAHGRCSSREMKSNKPWFELVAFYLAHCTKISAVHLLHTVQGLYSNTKTPLYIVL